MIPLYKPYLPKNVLQHAYKAIESSWISGHGDYLNLIKDKFKEIFGYKYVLLTNNGTSAGHLMAIGLKYKYPEIKKIVVPKNVYIAAWNVFKINPVYDFEVIDSNLDTWCGDYEKYLEKHPENNVLLIVHNISSIVNVPSLKEKYPNNIYLEDNCEGFLGKYNKKYTGTESFLSTISFFGNKNITSGEGGALILNDDSLFDFLNSTRCQGYTNEKFIFDKLGYNYRMTNIEASLIYGQLLILEEIKEKKYEVFSQYEKMLGYNDNIVLQETSQNTESSRWLFGIRFLNFDENNLKEMELKLFKNGIETRRMFPPITKHKHYENLSILEGSNSQKIYESSLILPSYPELNKYQINKICQLILENE